MPSTDHPVRLSALRSTSHFSDGRNAKTGCSPSGPSAGARSQVTRESGRSRSRFDSDAAVAGTGARAGARGGNHPDHHRARHRAFAHDVLPRHPDSGSGCLGVSRIPHAVLRVVPTMTIVNGLLRSRRGATIVEASRQGLRISERGAWRTRRVAAINATGYFRRGLQQPRLQCRVGETRGGTAGSQVATPRRPRQ